MNGYEAFLNGLKPAYIAVDRYEQEQCNELKRKGYPWIRCSDDVSTMFFANDEIKNQFLAEINGVSPLSHEETLIVGKYLGYPPKACEFFVAACDDESLHSKRAGYRYYGIRFVGNIDDRMEIAQWLWENIPASPKPVEVEYRRETMKIENKFESS